MAQNYIKFEKLVSIFDWKYFEEFVEDILGNYGYKTTRNFRFSIDTNKKRKYKLISKTTKKPQKRFEIDIVGIKNNSILFIDAKYWKKDQDHTAAISQAANTQSRRSAIFAEEPKAFEKLIQKFNINFQREYIKKIKAVKREKGALKDGKIWVYPIIIQTGVSRKKVNDYGVPIVLLDQLSDFMQNFSQNSRSFVKYKIKRINIQGKLV